MTKIIFFDNIIPIRINKSVSWGGMMWEDLGQIKKLRQKLGLTQSELAKLSGISQSMIAKIEKGRVEPSYTVAKRIFIALEDKMKEHHETLMAKDICTQNVISISPEDPIEKAVELMRENAISQLPVIHEGKVVGSVTEGTLVANYEKINNGTKVREIMEDPFPVVSYNTPLSLIKETLKIYPAVIMVKNGEISGIITKADLLRRRVLKFRY